MQFLSEQENSSAAVIGMGYVGSAVAGVLAGEGVDVVGIDVNPSLVAQLEQRRCWFSEPGLPELLYSGLDSGRLRVTTDYDLVSGVDVVIIAVGTPVQDTELVDTYLRTACTELAPRLRKGQLVILKSTVPPGVSRNVVAPLLESGGLKVGEDIGLAFCPERLSEGQALQEMRTFPIAIGGFCPDSAAAAAAFWEQTVGVRTITCTSMESAEMVKLASNWWIDHNIAMANELAMLCGALDVDVLEVIGATNTMRKGSGNVNILLPSVGVGGSCLTKDPWMVWRAARDRDVELETIAVAREVNDSMPAYTVDLITDELARTGRTLAGSKIAIFGVAFKNNTGDLRATPALPVVTRLQQGGAEVAIFDPLADAGEVKKIFGQAPVETAREALSGADCIAVLARHDQFDDVDFVALRDAVAPSCVIIDGRAYYSRETIDRFRENGFAYRGIGR
ncbi:UDP-N-acetyl-D-mannosaminuronic acid dehydrogenase [Sphaerisporangium melleum]|uniref:UDP-N-acetyl-D-mannosaminuronic acid dehydrogenase n=1 Tax=Sphaerisporangium melleum TaxID=321316 RepID=A0A917QX26_9ACTN|nr:nucleotide sugar dehydrogenase [Sphaerisporangium melleum]GGK75016.1 UDP-N-acetyl-D-mannosaminuronic acid dehydrogenase [Sphaerisporangium melleum]GII70988.1 UDP-N-acetyl-D-mannosaminuronic acid dehydrogenase [Sphaerisporangium melleum]